MPTIIVANREYTVTERGDCLEWGTKYPKIHLNGTKVRVSRILLNVADPAIHVRHTCDNPYCVNVDHLIVGSHADNMRDKQDRGTCKKLPDWVRNESFEYWQAYGPRPAARCLGISYTAMRDRMKRF